MSFDPDAPGLQFMMLNILNQLAETPGKRTAILRILWNIAAGAIISSHCSIRSCDDAGVLVLEIDDAHWMQEIRKSARIIIERVNHMLSRINRNEFAIQRVDLMPAYHKRSVRIKPEQPPKMAIPASIESAVDKLPEKTRKAVLEWYQVVMSEKNLTDQSGN